MRSIERHLAGWVLGASGLGALLLGLAAYLFILDDLNEAFDNNLAQVAQTLAEHPALADLAMPAQAPRADKRDTEAPIVIVRWTPDGRRTFSTDPDVALPFLARTGLTRQRVSGIDWDVFTVARTDGVVQAAQVAAAQEREAAESAARLLLPFAALIGVLGALLIYALRRGLQPLDAAATLVAARSAASLAPIDDPEMPREIRPLVDALNDLMARLGSAFDTQRRFVADAAHELRTPVTALRLQLQLLEGARDEPERRMAIDELRAGIARAQHLIEQLLDLSRMEPGAQQQRSEPLALDELARATVGRLSVQAEHRGVDLGAQAGARVPLCGDPDALTILLNNLVDNALRHAGHGGVVDVVAEITAGRPTLRVIDDGPGIEPAERTRVFDRFRRGDSPSGPDAERGSGLGLAIVKAIADRHSAEVSLHTAPSGRGLEARVVFTAGSG